MKKTLIAVCVLAVAAATPTAYGANEKQVQAPAVKKPSLMKEKIEPDASGNITGKVVETMDAGGYTYICLEKGGKKTWVAVSQMPVTVGATMSFLPGQIMPNFTSKSLGRTFDSIVFSSGPAGGGHGAPAVVPGGDPSHVGSKANVAALDKTIKVEKAAGADAYTVAEVYAKRASLDRKRVVVKGKVVKFSQGIMGKNWVHIQDGSGDQRKGTHNLVATTQDRSEVGDIVTIAGTLAKDRDFGAGYLYKAIIENAAVRK